MAETQLQLQKEIEEISSREQVCASVVCASVVCASVVCASVEHDVYLQINIYVNTSYFTLICMCGWVNG